MSRASDYFKYYRTDGATALVGDILAGEIGYISGGRAVGGGGAPAGSLTAFYRTADATIDANKVAAWKTAFGKYGIILGLYYPGPIPASGGLMGMDNEAALYDAVNDTFTM